MKIKIAENIRSCRKERGMTQEQLAEALNVTVGAVSKWELGASVPELAMIAAMADFFETSVDALIGYEQQNGKAEAMLERIKAYRREKNFTEGALLAEKALQKYPNHFRVVHACAEFYNLHGVEMREKKSFSRSIALLKRAIDLLSQNTDPEINETTLRNGIAENYLILGKHEKALEELKKNNLFGINNAVIGSILATELNRPAEAFDYLDRALGYTIQTFFRTVLGYANAYEKQHRYRNTVEAFEFLFLVFDAMRKEADAVIYTDKVHAMLLASCALEMEKLDEPASAEAYLRKAYEKAIFFDAAPNYGMTGLKFCEGAEKGAVAYDDIGATAMDGVERVLYSGESELLPLWESMKHAEKQ